MRLTSCLRRFFLLRISRSFLICFTRFLREKRRIRICALDSLSCPWVFVLVVWVGDYNGCWYGGCFICIHTHPVWNLLLSRLIRNLRSLFQVLRLIHRGHFGPSEPLCDLFGEEDTADLCARARRMMFDNCFAVFVRPLGGRIRCVKRKEA